MEPGGKSQEMRAGEEDALPILVGSIVSAEIIAWAQRK